MRGGGDRGQSSGKGDAELWRAAPARHSSPRALHCRGGQAGGDRRPREPKRACLGQFLTGYGQVPVSGPGVGDLCYALSLRTQQKNTG